MTTELADYSTIFRSPCLLWCKSCERSMNIERLSNDIEHILLIDTRSILVFHLNMPRGIAYYILYELNVIC